MAIPPATNAQARWVVAKRVAAQYANGSGSAIQTVRTSAWAGLNPTCIRKKTPRHTTGHSSAKTLEIWAKPIAEPPRQANRATIPLERIDKPLSFGYDPPSNSPRLAV